MKRILFTLFCVLGMSALSTLCAKEKVFNGDGFSISYPDSYAPKQQSEQGMSILSFTPAGKNTKNTDELLMVVVTNFSFLQDADITEQESTARSTLQSFIGTTSRECASAEVSEITRTVYADGHVGFDAEIIGTTATYSKQYVYAHVAMKNGYLYQVAVLANSIAEYEKLKAGVKSFQFTDSANENTSKAESTQVLVVKKVNNYLSRAFTPLTKNFRWNDLSFKYPDELTVTYEENEVTAELQVIGNGIGSEGMSVFNLNCEVYDDLSHISREEWETSVFVEIANETNAGFKQVYSEIDFRPGYSDNSKPYPNYIVPFTGMLMGRAVKGIFEYRVMGNYYVVTISQSESFGWYLLFECIKSTIKVQ